jgi:hypothetical protein
MNLLSKRTRLIAVVIALLVLIVSSVTGAAAAGTTDPSLIAYWTFDEGSGTTANDSSGYGRTATLNNGASFNNAAFPAHKFADPFALNLVGTSHQYVNVGTGINLAKTSFTVMAWAKRSTTAGKQWVIGYGTNSTDKALVLGFCDNDHVTCAFYNDDVDTVNATDPNGTFVSGTFADTNWHHLACTYNATTRQRVVYVDGIGWQYTNSPAIQANGAFNIGRVPWSDGYFSGSIDDVRVYNRALSQQAIKWLAAGNLDTALWMR